MYKLHASNIIVNVSRSLPLRDESLLVDARTILHGPKYNNLRKESGKRDN